MFNQMSFLVKMTDAYASCTWVLQARTFRLIQTWLCGFKTICWHVSSETVHQTCPGTGTFTKGLVELQQAWADGVGGTGETRVSPSVTHLHWGKWWLVFLCLCAIQRQDTTWNTVSERDNIFPPFCSFVICWKYLFTVHALLIFTCRQSNMPEAFFVTGDAALHPFQMQSPFFFFT